MIFNFIFIIFMFFYLNKINSFGFIKTNKTFLNADNKVLNKNIQKLVFIKSNKIFKFLNNYSSNILIDQCEIFNENIILKSKIYDKKVLHIAPAGIYGFYNIGICKIIKERYNLENYIFNGASAGAWNSLFMVYKHNHSDLINFVINKLNEERNKSIKDIQIKMKNIILSNYSTDDFDFDKLFINVCVLENKKFINYVYTDFENLESAIDCCIASSNIPILTGDFFYKYKNKLSFDGIFLPNINISCKKHDFTIKKCIFGRKKFFISLFDKKNDVLKLYNLGIEDTLNNIDYLDDYFK